MKKDLYSVGEIAKMFNLNSQTLRFYDKIHLFKPEFINPKTSYRYYTSEQFERLTMINYLSSLDMSLENIKEFFLKETDDSLGNFLEKELENTKEKIVKFENIKIKLEEELLILKNQKDFNKINIHYFKERIITFQLLKSSNSQELHKAFSIIDEKYCKIENKRFGTIISENSIHRGNYQFHSAFIFIEDENNLCSLPYSLKEGEYICIVSLGNFSEQEKSYNLLLEYIKNNNLEINGEGILIMLAHNHTKNHKLLYEIQIPVKSKQIV